MWYYSVSNIWCSGGISLSITKSNKIHLWPTELRHDKLNKPKTILKPVPILYGSTNNLAPNI